MSRDRRVEVGPSVYFHALPKLSGSGHTLRKNLSDRATTVQSEDTHERVVNGKPESGISQQTTRIGVSKNSRQEFHGPKTRIAENRHRKNRLPRKQGPMNFSHPPGAYSCLARHPPKAGMRTRLPARHLLVDLSLYQESHDLACSSANHHESSVSEVAFDRQISGVAYSSMDLQGLVCYLKR